MKLIEFEEQTIVIAKDQPEYEPLPAHQFEGDREGRIACCWQLTWRERIQLLFTGVVWHQVLTFGRALQPQLLTVEKPIMLPGFDAWWNALQALALSKELGWLLGDQECHREGFEFGNSPHDELEACLEEARANC